MVTLTKSGLPSRRKPPEKRGSRKGIPNKVTKDLKDEESRRRQRRECSRLRPVGNALAEVNATRDDYNRRKPLAWAAARAVLAQVHWPIEPYRPPNQGHPIP